MTDTSVKPGERKTTDRIRSILPPDFWGGIMDIGGKFGTGKTWLATDADLPQNVALFDFDFGKAAGLHETQQFGLYHDMKARAHNKKAAWLWYDALDLFNAIPENHFTVVVLDNVTELMTACKAALESGITDIWQFEAMQWDAAAQHYVSNYQWPTVHHGFLAAGRVNPAAIAYLDKEAGNQLHLQLIRDLIGVGSPLLYWLLQKATPDVKLIRKVAEYTCDWKAGRSRKSRGCLPHQ